MNDVREAAEIAYSEMAFAVHDLMAGRLSPAQCEYRSKRLAEAADKLRHALDQEALSNDRH